MNGQATTYDGEFDYVVVGSGAGGGTLAARLAEHGHTVLVLEAGSDPKNAPVGTGRGDAVAPDRDRLPDDYDVPTFHAFSSENDAMKWDYFVRHYADDAVQRQDDKFVAAEDGVLYPRAGCLGGCTAHNAMITVYPANRDWDAIAALTGDDSWNANAMRRHFERLERCRHRNRLFRWLARFGLDPTRHGWNGWLQTEKSLPIWDLLHDRRLVVAITTFVVGAFLRLPSRLRRLWWFFAARLDPNDWRLVKADAFGLHYPPLATASHARLSTRERLLDVKARHAGRLTIELDALVTRVLFDASNRAVGVEFLKGERLYRAHANPSPEAGVRRAVRARREVILAAGAFNTPQLLMLSGIGPADHLAAHAVPVRVDLPGVGRNLQDRYEVCVVHQMKFAEWEALKGATFSPGDPHYQEWKTLREGFYTGNGAVIAAILRSAPERPVPDLFCFALLTRFSGYFPGYSKVIAESLNHLSWAVLKGHTNNRGGVVRLKSADPRDRPAIDFHYFEEGTGDHRQDLDSVVTGVKFVRDLMRPLKRLGVGYEEILPGPQVASDDDIRHFVRTRSWGHHASCTCPIGADGDPNAVLDSAFRVRGTTGLRVVDASVFPRIPGLFIVSAIYMIAEKAAEVILADAGTPLPRPRPWWRRFLAGCLFCGGTAP